MSTGILDLPRVPAFDVDAADEFTPSPNEANTIQEDSAGTVQTDTVVVNRDPADIRTILRLTSSGIGHVVVYFMLVGIILCQAFAGGNLVVVDRTVDGDRVVYMNGKQIAGGVAVMADNPGDEMKVSASKLFTKFLYQVDTDPDIRGANIENALRMMDANAAQNLIKAMNSQRTLQTQRDEQWQAAWIPISVTVDKDDPNKVLVVGRQEITRLVGGTRTPKNQQLVITLKLYKDKKRTDYNQNTGYMIENILNYQEIPIDIATTSTDSTVTPAPAPTLAGQP